MALKTAYADIATADGYLSDKSDWMTLSDAVKDRHLLNATYFLDGKYSCVWSTPAETEQAYATSLLAYIDSTDGLFTLDETNGSPIVEEEVEAGSVKVKTRYSGNYSNRQLTSLDKYPQITAILKGYCVLSGTNTLTNYKLVRT